MLYEGWSMNILIKHNKCFPYQKKAPAASLDSLQNNLNMEEGPASCKLSSSVAGILQMIIRSGRPLANDHLDWPASSK